MHVHLIIPMTSRIHKRARARAHPLKALNASGRDVYFSLCGWNTWYAPVGDSLGNSWRIAGDGTNWGALYVRVETFISVSVCLSACLCVSVSVRACPSVRAYVYVCACVSVNIHSTVI